MPQLAATAAQRLQCKCKTLELKRHGFDALAARRRWLRLCCLRRWLLAFALIQPKVLCL